MAEVVEDKEERRYALVFNGGGVKGIAFAGALLELERRIATTFTSFCGTSAGAITAALVALGYNARLIEKIVLSQSFSNFLDRGWNPPWDVPPWKQSTPKPPSFPVRILRTLRLPLMWAGMILPVLRGALHSTAPIGRFIHYVATWRPRSATILRTEPDPHLPETFGALPHELTVVASQTGGDTLHVFEKPDDDLEFAVRCSMAIPGYFEPQRVGRNVLYDGGLVANFAFAEFIKRHPNYETYGLYLYDSDSRGRASDSPPSILSAISHAFQVFFGQDELKTIQANFSRIIRIDIAPIRTIDFNLGEDDKELLISTGRLAAMRFLLQEPHSLPLGTGMVPSEQEYEVLLARVQQMRADARKRWRWPHRRRIIGFYSIALIVATLLIWLAGIAVGTVRNALVKPAQPPLRTLNVAIILNGNAEYVDTAHNAFENRLTELIKDAGYVLHFESVRGEPFTGSSGQNQAALAALLGRFNRDPDYLVPIGTQVATDAKAQYLGRIPIVFIALTDPVGSGIVPSLGPDPKRGNIAGSAYASPISSLYILKQLFPDASFAFLFATDIPQDLTVRNAILAEATRHPQFDISTVEAQSFTAWVGDKDIVFGWYYLNRSFSDVLRHSKRPIVAGNMRDMARGAIAMIANNDDEVGRLGAEVLVESLKGEATLCQMPVRRASGAQVAINRDIARKFGIRIGNRLQKNTLEVHSQ